MLTTLPTAILVSGSSVMYARHVQEEVHEHKPATVRDTAKANYLAWSSGNHYGRFLAVVQALVWSKGMVDGEVEGYAAAGILIPLIIAYAIAGRKAKRNWDKLGFWFAGLTLFSLLLEVTRDLSAK